MTFTYVTMVSGTVYNLENLKKEDCLTARHRKLVVKALGVNLPFRKFVQRRWSKIVVNLQYGWGRNRGLREGCRVCLGEEVGECRNTCRPTT